MMTNDIFSNNDEPNIKNHEKVVEQDKINLAKGRNIVSILHERSIRGCTGIGGVRVRKLPTTIARIDTKDEAMEPTTTDKSSSITDAICGNCIGMPLSNMKVNDNEQNDNMSVDAQDDTKANHTHLNYFPCNITHELQNYSEIYSITNYTSSYINLKPSTDTSPVVSTISVSFSNDGRVLASTHGDHTVKITCCHSGKLLRSLEGHPRTPWTVKFHPTNSLIVASGCLGYQVRVWNWNYMQQSIKRNDKYYTDMNDSTKSQEYSYDGNRIGLCLNMIRLHSAIISLAFHPTCDIIAAATGTNLVLWDYKEDGNEIHSEEEEKSYPVCKIDHESPLRCVHFLPNGNTIIIGCVNPTEGGNGVVPATTIFSLRLYDFNIHKALKQRISRAIDQSVLSNGRTLISRALLYNDGGFDVSPCGNYLCACAEYWLPENITCAADLFPKDEDYDDDGTHDAVDKDENDNWVVLSNSMQTSDSSSTNGALLVTTPSSDVSTQVTSADNPIPFRLRSRFSRYPSTPPIQHRQYIPLSPPPPPGRRLPGGLTDVNNRNYIKFHMRRQQDQQLYRQAMYDNVRFQAADAAVEGKIVPHVVIVNLTPSKLGQLLEASPLDKRKASGVTCVKFSPSAEYCLLGYGVRETTNTSTENMNTVPPHTVTTVYRIKGGMTHVSTMMSLDDDVNIARFHPHSGHGFVYGTKQGKLRIMSPKPWNYFCSSFNNV